MRSGSTATADTSGPRPLTVLYRDFSSVVEQMPTSISVALKSVAHTVLNAVIAACSFGAKTHVGRTLAQHRNHAVPTTRTVYSKPEYPGALGWDRLRG